MFSSRNINIKHTAVLSSGHHCKHPDPGLATLKTHALGRCIDILQKLFDRHIIRPLNLRPRRHKLNGQLLSKIMDFFAHTRQLQVQSQDFQ